MRKTENATGQATNVYRAMVRGSGSTDKHSFSSVRNCCLTELFDVLHLNTGSALEFRMLPNGTFSSICVNREGIRTLFRFMNTLVQFCGALLQVLGLYVSENFKFSSKYFAQIFRAQYTVEPPC